VLFRSFLGLSLFGRPSQLIRIVSVVRYVIEGCIDVVVRGRDRAENRLIVHRQINVICRITAIQSQILAIVSI
jgi:hypothetical protein